LKIDYLFNATCKRVLKTSIGCVKYDVNKAANIADNGLII
ncbi:unnamed protein product, partial [Rotaria sp. Silwood2]